jgi:outer membrane protein assembly factor BamB
MLRFLLGGALALAFPLATPGRLLAEPGAVLWSETLDVARTDDAFLGLAAEGGRVFAVGRTGADAGQDGLVRCYDEASGELCWEDLFDRAGGEDEATAVAASGKRVFVVGSGEGFTGERDFVVRSYDARTGVLLWDDVFDPSGAPTNGGHESVAARGRTVVVAGRFETPAHEVLAARAYDARTGAVLWTNTFDPSGDFVEVGAVAVAGPFVVVAGASEDSHSLEDDFLIRAIDRKDGTTRWTDVVDGTASGNDGANALALTRSKVFVAGWLDDGPPEGGGSGNDLLVRAYDLSSGALLWEDLTDEAPGSERGLSVAFAGGRLLVAGSAREFDGGNALPLVRCYDARRGSLLWDDPGTEGSIFGAAQAVAESKGIAVVAGAVQEGDAPVETLVRGYSIRTGALAFEDRSQGAESGNAAAAMRHRAFVAGAVLDPAPPEPPEPSTDARIVGYSLR